MKGTNFPALLERFFLQRLIRQRQVSPHTISSYRDTFRLLLHFAKQRLHKPPSGLTLEEVDAPLITAFLDELETKRGITARSRNLRLTAKDMSFLECPQCGRLTSRLYGSNVKVSGFCRWCLDMGGGLGLGISVAFVPINMAKTDPTTPAKNAWDILPLEISQKIKPPDQAGYKLRRSRRRSGTKGWPSPNLTSPSPDPLIGTVLVAGLIRRLGCR